MASCADAYLDVSGDGPTQHFVGSCPSTWGANMSNKPVAYFFQGGAAPATAQLDIVGCLQDNASAPSLQLVVFGADTQKPGAYSGMAQYVDASNVPWFAPQKPADIAITKVTEVTGDSVEGSYQAPVFGNGQEKTLSGTFRACKVPDEIAP